MTHTIQSASRGVRWLYAATLIGALLATRALWLQWPVGSAWSIGLGMVVVACALLPLWRVAMVLWRASTLDAPQPQGCVRWLRRLGIGGMAFGALSLLVGLALPWILANWSAVGTEALGAVELMAGLFVMAMSATATGGVTLFELSRLLAFEHALRHGAGPAVEPPSPPARPSPNPVIGRLRAALPAERTTSTEDNP